MTDPERDFLADLTPGERVIEAYVDHLWHADTDHQGESDAEELHHSAYRQGAAAVLADMATRLSDDEFAPIERLLEQVKTERLPPA